MIITNNGLVTWRARPDGGWTIVVPSSYVQQLREELDRLQPGDIDRWLDEGADEGATAPESP